MPFSSHSHSGQFCAHAKNSLEDVVKMAISQNIEILALTEHIPRENIDLYPEEIAAKQTAAGLRDLFDAYVTEAVRLRDLYEPRISLLIGFETEWIRSEEAWAELPPAAAPSDDTKTPPLASPAYLDRLRRDPRFDLFVGSVHHVHGIPIDFDRETYERARVHVSSGAAIPATNTDAAERRLFETYFDAQYDMLKKLRPPVVGHFDLIRLLSDERDGRLKRGEGAADHGASVPPLRWDGALWDSHVRRNLEFIARYGGLLEVNSSALRKGLREPYPAVEICKEFLGLGGRFTVSDDSHGTEQVGLNYVGVLAALKAAGIEELYIKNRRLVSDAPHALKLEKKLPHQNSADNLKRFRLDQLADHPGWRRGGEWLSPARD